MELKEYEEGKLRIIKRLLENIRAAKAAGDELRVKKQMEEALKAVPTLVNVIKEERRAVAKRLDVRTLLDAQLGLVSKDLKGLAQLYLGLKDLEKLNECYSQIIKVLEKLSSTIGETLALIRKRAA